MIKLLIFDLDGVLIDSKEAHFETLNSALFEVAGAEYVISKEDHLKFYDGLSTKKKLELLSRKKNLPEALHNDIWRTKQSYTIDALNDIRFDFAKVALFKDLTQKGYQICVASNAIEDTVVAALRSLGVTPWVRLALSNDHVSKPKPSSEIYLKCCLSAGVDPKETLIIEDSLVGRQGAIASGCHLFAVKDVNWKHNELMDILDHLNNTSKNLQWYGGKMNVLIPMAGAGSRFEKAGYTFPKPLIDVRGKPMIQLVVENLNIQANFIFICQNSHIEKYNLKTLLNLIAPGCKIIGVDGVTEGAACTTLLAQELINNEEPLLIANSDQVIDWGDAGSAGFYYAMEADKKIGAGIVTFKSTHPKWSFVKLDEDGLINQVAEKNPISDNATVGIYYWARGCDYVSMAKKMITLNDRVNGEFYVAPVFNHAIDEGAVVKPYFIKQMWGIGTPEDLNYYLENNK